MARSALVPLLPVALAFALAACSGRSGGNESANVAGNGAEAAETANGSDDDAFAADTAGGTGKAATGKAGPGKGGDSGGGTAAGSGDEAVRKQGERG